MSEQKFLYVKKDELLKGKYEYLSVWPYSDGLYSFTKDRSKTTPITKHHFESLLTNVGQTVADNLIPIKPNQIDFVPSVSMLNKDSMGMTFKSCIERENKQGRNSMSFNSSIPESRDLHHFLTEHKIDFEKKGYHVLLNAHYDDKDFQDVVIWGDN